MKLNPRMVQGLFLISGLILAVSLFFHIKGAFLGLYSNTTIFYRVYVSIQLVLETLIVGEVSFLLITIGIDKPYLDRVDVDSIKFDTYPDIDVVLPIRYVPLEKIQKTVEGFIGQNYPREKLHIYVADDTPDKRRSAEYRELCEKHDLEYFYRPENKDYKSGMLNLLLPHLKSEYACFYDYDQVPTKDAVKVLVHSILENPEAGYVQLKKEFRGLVNYISEWSALLYLQFFELMQPRKERAKVGLFAGSTAIFRIAALREIGGFATDTFTEDTNTSIKLFLAGYRGKFVNFIGSIGDVPSGYSNQISQVWRWSHGGTHTLRCRYSEVMRSKNLNLNQKIETLSTLFMTPVLFIAYIYGFSFIPLIFMGIESRRAYLFGLPSTILIPLSLLITYILFVVYSISKRKLIGESEFRYAQIPGFIHISIGSNLLLLDASLYGLLGKLGPKSPYGMWTRKINIKLRSTFLLITGLILLYISWIGFTMGIPSAYLILLLASSFFSPFIISVIQRK